MSPMARIHAPSQRQMGRSPWGWEPHGTPFPFTASRRRVKIGFKSQRQHMTHSTRVHAAGPSRTPSSQQRGR